MRLVLSLVARNTLAYGRGMTAARNQTLTAQDWIAAAFTRLGTGGITAVRAEAIARDLGVSKGSFYWHFKDIPDLHARLLAQWWDEGPVRLLAQADTAGADPQARLARLLVLATTHEAGACGGLSTEAAIRDWARTDPLAAQVLAQADAIRRAYVTERARDAGLPRSRAEQVARVIMLAFTGAVHLGAPNGEQMRDDMNTLVDCLLAD